MKSGSLFRLKNNISNYKLFYAVATIALNPIWDALKIYSLYWLDRISLMEWFEYYDLLIITVLVAFALKNNLFSKWVSHLILASTLIAQIFLFTMFLDSLFSNYIIFIFFLIPVFVYFLWLTMYFLDKADLIDKKPTITGVLFFMVMIIVFYFAMYLPLEIVKYQASTIPPFSILSNFWVPILLSSLIVFILFFVFMYIYKIKRNYFCK